MVTAAPLTLHTRIHNASMHRVVIPDHDQNNAVVEQIPLQEVSVGIPRYDFAWQPPKHFSSLFEVEHLKSGLSLCGSNTTLPEKASKYSHAFPVLAWYGDE